MSDVPSRSSIADLSYRNYDGPINPPLGRWMVIARAMILKAFRKKSLWVISLGAGWYYIVMMVIIFFLQQMAASGNMQILDKFLKDVHWNDQFWIGFGFSQHLLLVATLVVGAGTIANDNRANSLLVYLSKPCRKIDYLIGKWIGVFVPVLVVVAIPTLAFYVYALFSFRQEGFFNDPWLIVKILCLLPIAAAIHSSLILTISSLFKQGTVAGAVYAGIYFMGYFFTLLMKLIWDITDGARSSFVINLNYCSIDGLQIGLAKAILNAGSSRPFMMPARNHIALPAPSLIPYLAIVAAIIGGSIYFTWTRVRAVEVV